MASGVDDAASARSAPEQLIFATAAARDHHKSPRRRAEGQTPGPGIAARQLAQGLGASLRRGERNGHDVFFISYERQRIVTKLQVRAPGCRHANRGAPMASTPNTPKSAGSTPKSTKGTKREREQPPLAAGRTPTADLRPIYLRPPEAKLPKA